MSSQYSLRSRSRSRSRSTSQAEPLRLQSTPPAALDTQLAPVEHDAFTSFILKPHTITVLILGLALVLYMAFFYPPADMSIALKRGLAAMAFIFLAYCGVQLRDSMLIRPHPAVWRVVTGVGLLYLMALTFILQLKVEDARDVVHVLFTDSGRPLEERSYATDCRLYNATTHLWDFTSVKKALMDEFIVAHLLGWYFSALMIRDAKLCMVLSIAFELVEISFQHWLENFKECWWDHLILDMLVCNTIGIYAGLWTSRFFELRELNWMGYERKATHRRQSRWRRLLGQFAPLSWTRYKWKMFSSFTRFAAVVVALALYLWIKTNSFFVKYVLYIPPRSPFNTFRLLLMWATSLPGVREYYEYITNPECTRLGPNSWLSLGIIVTEVLLIVKFSVTSTGGPTLFPRAFPPAIKLSMALFVLMFGLWAAINFPLKAAMKQRRDKPLWLPKARRALWILRHVSFLPFVYMFVAECPDLHWGQSWAEAVWPTGW